MQEFQNWLMIKLVASFKLRTSHLYLIDYPFIIWFLDIEKNSCAEKFKFKLTIIKSKYSFTGTAPEVFSQIDDYFSNLFSPLRTQEELLFPSLTEEQRKFAVNPSYPEFAAPIFGDLTATQGKCYLNKHFIK